MHGDLHVENPGTYLNSDGRLVFDINDFDEAYLGRFTWDLQRFAASLALVAGRRRCPRTTYAGWWVATCAPTSPRSTSTAVRGRRLRPAPRQHRRSDPRRPVAARQERRPTSSTRLTEIEDGTRVFRHDDSVRRLSKRERSQVVSAFERYLESIPETKRFDRALFYELQ